MDQHSKTSLLNEIQPWVIGSHLLEEHTADEIPTLWVEHKDIVVLCDALRFKLKAPFDFLFDLTAIDETTRQHNVIAQRLDFTVVYLLRSYARNQDLRLKVALPQNLKSLASVTSIWPNANWYEREVWDFYRSSLFAPNNDADHMARSSFM
jgi:NADH-quinone oxidoreductase subunit C/D